MRLQKSAEAIVGDGAEAPAKVADAGGYQVSKKDNCRNSEVVQDISRPSGRGRLRRKRD